MKWFLLNFCVIGSLIDISLCAPNSIDEEAIKLNYRLATDILPIDYIIEFTPYFNNETDKEPFTFDGNVKIKLHSTKPDVKVIILHKEDLEIKKTKFETLLGNGSNFNIENVHYDGTTKKYSIFLDIPLVSEQLYELTLQYSGKLRTDMLGFYRSSYKDGNVTK